MLPRLRTFDFIKFLMELYKTRRNPERLKIIRSSFPINPLNGLNKSLMICRNDVCSKLLFYNFSINYTTLSFSLLKSTWIE